MVLTAIKNKIIRERKKQTELYQNSLENHSYYEKIRVSLIDQKEITSQYSI